MEILVRSNHQHEFVKASRTEIVPFSSGHEALSGTLIDDENHLRRFLCAQESCLFESRVCRVFPFREVVGLLDGLDARGGLSMAGGSMGLVLRRGGMLVERVG